MSLLLLIGMATLGPLNTTSTGARLFIYRKLESSLLTPKVIDVGRKQRSESQHSHCAQVDGIVPFTGMDQPLAHNV
jgi:hypothetical protein